MTKTFADFLSREQERSNSTIKNYIYNIEHDSDIPDYLKEGIIYAVSGEGKRLRPALVRLGFECSIDYSKNDTKNLFLKEVAEEIANRGALAIELIHTYSLVHDDLPAMDNDSLRRGRPTCHIKFDEATAILIGDSLLNQAFEVMLAPFDENITSKFTADQSKQFLEGLQRVAFTLGSSAGPAGMIGGQILDMQSENKEVSLEELKKLHSFKTGKLIYAALSLLPVFYNYSNLAKVLKEYSEHIGLAYQVVDDILDVTASTQELGKSGTDLQNEKSTFIKLIGLDQSRIFASDLIKKSKELLKEIAGNQQYAVTNDNLLHLADFSDYILSRSF